MNLKNHLQAKFGGEISSSEFIPKVVSCKAVESAGNFSIYRDSYGNQIYTGRKYVPLPSGLWLFRPGIVYKISTDIDIIEPFPENCLFIVMPLNDLVGIFGVVDPIRKLPTEGSVSFLIQCFRRFELGSDCSLVKFSLFMIDRDIDSEESPEEIPPVDKDSFTRRKRKV